MLSSLCLLRLGYLQSVPWMSGRLAWSLPMDTAAEWVMPWVPGWRVWCLECRTVMPSTAALLLGDALGLGFEKAVQRVHVQGQLQALSRTVTLAVTAV